MLSERSVFPLQLCLHESLRDRLHFIVDVAFNHSVFKVDTVVHLANLALVDFFKLIYLLVSICNVFLDFADLTLIFAALAHHSVDRFLPRIDPADQTVTALSLSLSPVLVQ